MIRGVTSTKETTTRLVHQSAKITPNDSRRIYLLVGFVEYGNALSNFMELLRTCSTDELIAMDEIVGEKEEFAVFTNLSGPIQSGPSTLSAKKKYDYDIDQGQRGFRWVIALARVEFGAMLASFSDVPSPFTTVAPHKFDVEEFKTLLLDGARSHYWALVNDKGLKKVFETNPENPIVLAYSRRMLIARNMLNAAMRAGQRDYSDVQVRELASWKDSMDETQTILVAKIELYLAQNMTRVTSRTRNRNSPFTQACNDLLRAEARETRAGTARVRRIP